MSDSPIMDHPLDVTWDQFESTLRTLYLEKNLSLEEVRREMVTTHQFNASKAQYELQFKKWNFRKNRTANEWKIVAHKIAKRKREHKNSDVSLNGNLINPKKLKKETLRYGSISGASEVSLLTALPPTPEGFIIRTPSPRATTPTSPSAQFCNVLPSINLNFVRMGCLPFYQFSAVFSQEGNLFPTIPRSGETPLIVLPQDLYLGALDALIGMNGKKFSGSFSQAFEALMPDNIFHSNAATVDMALSHGQASPVLDFMKLTMYLISNNFFEGTSDVSKRVYNWINQRLNTGLMEHLMSIGGPTVEALAENLFRLAIDAEDVGMIKKMMDLGIDPNEQVYRRNYSAGHEICLTPLRRACEMQGLELVRMLIDGGAKVDLSAWKGESTLLSALSHPDYDGEPRKLVDVELVRILLRAGAVVNPGSNKSPLSEAAKSGHVEVVDLLVSAGADVHFMDKFGNTLLMKAVSCKEHIPDEDVIHIVRTLLSAGADPQATSFPGFRGVTVLGIAMQRKNIELIQLLFNNGARVTESAFVCAAQNCDMNMAKMLLNFGGQVTEKVVEHAVVNDDPKLVFFLLETADEKTKIKGQTAAFIRGIKEGKMNLIDSLDAAGVQLTMNSKLTDAIIAATERGDTRVLCLLLDTKSKYRASSLESLGSALLTAIKHGQNDIVELLLSAGADVNATGIHRAPLAEAIGQRDSHLVRSLLAAGAVVNRFELVHLFGHSITTSVLPAVVTWGYYPLVRDIINAGAEVDAPEDGLGETALFIAVKKGDLATIKLLIDAGANVNPSVAILSGNTALKAAAQNNDLHMVQYLLGLGADPDEGSLVAAISGSVELVYILLEARLNRYKRYSKGYGCCALQFAVRLENATMIEILLAKGIDANTIIPWEFGSRAPPASPSSRASLDPAPICGESALGSAVKLDKSNDGWVVQMLLRGGADPNGIVTNDGETALLAAINEGNLMLINALIAGGAYVNPSIKSGDERTPLQRAVEKGRMDIVKILLEHGADVDAPPFDRYGATALQFAAIGGYVPIAELLLDRGVDVNASPAKIGGRTALEAAAEHGRIDMLQLLLSAGARTTGPGLEQYERAREFALKNGHISAKRVLENHNAEMEMFAAWDPMQMNFEGLDDFRF